MFSSFLSSVGDPHAAIFRWISRYGRSFIRTEKQSRISDGLFVLEALVRSTVSGFLIIQQRIQTLSLRKNVVIVLEEYYIKINHTCKNSSFSSCLLLDSSCCLLAQVSISSWDFRIISSVRIRSCSTNLSLISHSLFCFSLANSRSFNRFLNSSVSCSYLAYSICADNFSISKCNSFFRASSFWQCISNNFFQRVP